jgi:hypothetical protein
MNLYQVKMIVLNIHFDAYNEILTDNLVEESKTYVQKIQII